MKTWNETINTIILETIDKSWRLKTKFSAADVEKIKADTVSVINNAVKEIVIGEDDEPRNTLEHSRRNFLRAEQRNIVNGDQS